MPRSRRRGIASTVRPRKQRRPRVPGRWSNGRGAGHAISAPTVRTCTRSPPDRVLIEADPAIAELAGRTHAESVGLVIVEVVEVLDPAEQPVGRNSEAYCAGLWRRMAEYAFAISPYVLPLEGRTRSLSTRDGIPHQPGPPIRPRSRFDGIAPQCMLSACSKTADGLA
jgi:hypothetical protein